MILPLRVLLVFLPELPPNNVAGEQSCCTNGKIGSHKPIGLMRKNNVYPRSARAFYILTRFLSVLTSTLNYQI